MGNNIGKSLFLQLLLPHTYRRGLWNGYQTAKLRFRSSKQSRASNNTFCRPCHPVVLIGLIVLHIYTFLKLVFVCVTCTVSFCGKKEVCAWWCHTMQLIFTRDDPTEYCLDRYACSDRNNKTSCHFSFISWLKDTNIAWCGIHISRMFYS